MSWNGKGYWMWQLVSEVSQLPNQIQKKIKLFLQKKTDTPTLTSRAPWASLAALLRKSIVLLLVLAKRDEAEGE